jgi:tRNA A22 N-methylase
MRKMSQNEHGFILPLVLVVIALLAAGAGYMLTRGIAELQANTLNQDYELCILTGKNAMAILQAELEKDVNYSGTSGKVFDENGGFYEIIVFKTSDKLRYVEVESEYHDYQKKFSSEIELNLETGEAPSGQIVKFNWKMLGGV